MARKAVIALVLVFSAPFFLGLVLPAAVQTEVLDYIDILQSPRANWLTYNGGYNGHRFSPLKQINTDNIGTLSLQWSLWPAVDISNLRTTSLVYDGVMYVTNGLGMYAVNAGTGKVLWRQQNKKSYAGINRGAAILDNLVFYATDDCILIALNRWTGDIVWQNKFADKENGYYSTAAPLALKSRVVIGVSGGDNGARGFVASFSPKDGQKQWHFWTVPTGLNSGSETWQTSDDKRGGAATWLTGTYDPTSNIIYWPTGNPWPDFDGKDRQGDNLYSNSLVALDANNGNLKWYFQFMPHDTHDWDSNESPVLADARWYGRKRKLVLQANRNGFFYVLDRTNGQFLLGKPFVKKITWAKGLDNKGRPIIVPELDEPWEREVKGVCPGLVGATNWMSPSYSPDTNLFYVVALEHCDNERGEFYLRAIDIQNGNIKWEQSLVGRGEMMPGVLSTAGGLVFTGDRNGNFIAFNAKNGKKLWSFSTGKRIFSSPMSYSVNGRQYISIAAGPNILSFSLSN